jgi:hypothetical protein
MTKRTCGECQNLRLSGSGHFVCDHPRSSKLFRATGDSACAYFEQLESPKVEPESKLDQETIECWRINYGLDKRSPAEAARWWHDNFEGRAPAVCVAALGLALKEIARLQKESARHTTLPA